ncbi:hypothetical protein VTO42DRAFT_801 [Malbranchea cinnamomea]
MSPAPSSTVSSNTSGHSPDGQYRIVRKRNRVPLSCAPCRSRKLKCNRATPCENCVKRGDAPSCTYAQAANRKRGQAHQHAPASPEDMQNRIDRLENLVLSLMTNGAQSAGPKAAMAALSATGSSDSRQDAEDGNTGEEESDTEQVTRSFGIMKFDSQSQKSYYISEAHWASILNDIAEVKHYFSTHKAQYDAQAQIVASHKDPSSSQSALIFGVANQATEAEIRASFPSKYIADILISRYFAESDPSICIIHAPTFRKEYARYWQDPSKSTLVWVAMVFAMMRFALLSLHREGEEPRELRGKTLDMAAAYRNAMAQCLVIADYTKPHRYLIETLIVHIQAEIHQNRDAETSIWVMAGVATRLAMRMGYHRDSKMFQNISVFHGEMRRRVWAFIRQADLLISYQVGLPGMIRANDSDTDFPHNLYEEDFDEDSTELPPERPFSEPTPISYSITKCRLCSVFGRVLELSHKVKGTSYEEVMELDSELRRACEMIPERLRVRPMSECRNDPPHLIVCRFGVMSIYHKAQCVLHRPYLNRARDNPRYLPSRRACVESSLELLKYQAMQHAESGPGGLLQGRKWYNSSLSSHDFLLASTILAVDLFHDLHQSVSGRDPSITYGWGLNRQQEMIAALRRSGDIWNELKDQSIEAWKASAIIGYLLEKLGQKTLVKESQEFNAQDEKQNAAMTLGLLSSGMTPSGLPSPPSQLQDTMMRMDQNVSQTNPNLSDQGPGPSSPFSIFGQMPDMQPFNLDWDAWDNYIQSGGLDLTNQNWPTFDNQQVQQAPQPTVAAGRIDNDRNGFGERSALPPNIFLPNNVIPGGGVLLNSEIRFDGRRP